MGNKAKGKKETFYALGYSIVSKAITYLLLLVFANLYLPEEYGLGSFAFNIRNIIMLFAFIGLPDALVPFVVRKRKIDQIFSFVSAITFIVFIAGLGLLFYYPWIWPLVVTFPLIMLNSFAMSFWRAKSRHDIPFKVGFYSILLTLIFAFLLKDYGKFGVISAYSLGNLFSFIATAYPIRKEIYREMKFTKVRFNTLEMKTYISNGLAVTFIGSVFVFVGWLDSTLLGLLGNDFAQVAEFNVAAAIAGTVSLIPIALSMFMVTRASQIKSRQKSIAVLHRVTRISFFTSLLASILLVIFSPLLVRIFFPKYLGISAYISVLTLGMVFFSSYYIIYSYHIGKLDSKKMIRPVIVGLFANFILALILIPRYDVLGICYVVTLTHLFVLLIIASSENMKRIVSMSFLAAIMIWAVYFLGYWGLLIFAAIIPASLFLKIVTKSDILVITETIINVFRR